MSSTRKIEGWQYQANGGSHYFYPELASASEGHTPATLIIGGKGFTQQEVMALVHDLMHSQDSADAANGIPNAVCDWAGILNKHGITLSEHMEQTTKKPTNMETNINELEVYGVKYVRKDSASTPALNSENAVIVRCARAGVFFGYLEDVDLAKGVAKLKQARRLWYWSGAASLSQMAVDGTSKPKECKFPTAVSLIQVTEVLEVIPCTQKAVDSINSVATWKA